MIVSVVFNHKFDSKEYHYIDNTFGLKPFDDVLVPVGEYGHIEVATVVATWAAEVHHKYGETRYLKEVIALADRDKLTEQMHKEMAEVKAKYDKLLSKLK